MLVFYSLLITISRRSLSIANLWCRHLDGNSVIILQLVLCIKQGRTFIPHPHITHSPAITAHIPRRICRWRREIISRSYYHFYQLCATLINGISYSLWFKLHHSDSFMGESAPVSNCGQKPWSNLVRNHGDPQIILTFDNYYLDNAGRHFLRQGNVKYTVLIRSITKGRFGQLHNLLTHFGEKRSDWAGRDS